MSEHPESWRPIQGLNNIVIPKDEDMARRSVGPDLVGSETVKISYDKTLPRMTTRGALTASMRHVRLAAI